MATDEDQARRIAEQDAQLAYRDLSLYVVSVVRSGNDWQVDYELKDPNRRGGGPHYVISAETGEILSKEYEQ